MKGNTSIGKSNGLIVNSVGLIDKSAVIGARLLFCEVLVVLVGEIEHDEGVRTKAGERKQAA